MKTSTLKNKFFSKRLKIKRNTVKIEADFYMYSMRSFGYLGQLVIIHIFVNLYCLF